MNRWLSRLLALSALSIGTAIVFRTSLVESSGDEIPTVRVQRAQVDTSITTTGELRADRTIALTAPPAGDQLRLVALKTSGADVQAGEVVLAFDPSDHEDVLAQQRAQLREAELEIAKLEAETLVRLAEHRVELLTARFDARRAELDVRGNELLSSIVARQNDLALDEARQRVAQLEAGTRTRSSIDEAAMTLVVEKRNQAQLAIRQAQSVLDSLVVVAPMNGVVSVNGNRDGVTYYYAGVTVPEFREGDSVAGGRPVAELLDVSRINVAARVPEFALPHIARGQRASVTLDGSEVTIPARVGHIGLARGPTGLLSLSDAAVRWAEISLTLDDAPSIAKPGLSATVRLVGEPLRGVLFLPRQAIFTRDSRTHVYARTSDRFTLRRVTVTSQTETTAIVTNLEEGLEVALAEPDRRQ